MHLSTSVSSISSSRHDDFSGCKREGFTHPSPAQRCPSARALEGPDEPHDFPPPRPERNGQMRVKRAHAGG